MNKNILTVFAAASALLMVSCDTPSDLRPEAKVTTEYVEPGTRKTFNVTDAGTLEATGGAVQPGEVEHGDDDMLNHDPGGNRIRKGEPVEESETYNEAETVENR
ncbi:hypothetical protein [Pontibacter akesuensis]|uniref:Lipoprotein n=1 Tax=Pontibacter akesuensis TaxID=388950 RepID=A0A1I7I4K8_9BACT|nr:hypothetical protein [Pontibacter akesuensis]GHA65189.1 hypothetical protein GCM10007389_17480 [Pontibacter akesuensis]SFU67841.1 hypothetical protein SAMN04487941_1909 [Pontibacter akesuensis]